MHKERSATFDGEESMSVSKGVKLQYLRAWREWRGISQEELKELSGVTAATISRIENGAPARFETIGKLSTALQISREQLLHSEPGKEKHGAA
jgi:transcriptional regulator with XRE-family HTH domain